MNDSLQGWKQQGVLEDKLKDLVKQGKAVRLKAYCMRHERMCNIDRARGTIHIAGTPCTAHSSMGDREQQNSMPFAHFLCWCGLRRELEEDVIVQECVDSFPREAFTELLDMYDWSFAVIDPEQFGFPVRRNRQWAVFRVCVFNTFSFRICVKEKFS